MTKVWSGEERRGEFHQVLVIFFIVYIVWTVVTWQAGNREQHITLLQYVAWQFRAVNSAAHDIW